ncbi:MAG: nuclease [Candidatus Omnitrophica bacterium]|nr:nuclease [Candidatus Omnitrophota bacterium]
MRKYLFFFLFLSLSCLIPPDYGNIYVTEVIDGDTVRLENGRLLRYIGVDTPEVRVKRGTDFVYAPEPYALRALEYNRGLVEHKRVRVEFDVEKTDKYGRLLGYVFSGDEFVNKALLTRGYAVLLTIPPNVKYTKEFTAAQRAAREAGRGLWAEMTLIPASRAHEHIARFRTVRGRVESTGESEHCVYLNFGADWRTDFTAVIFKNSLQGFEKRNIDPETYYRGKCVEVRGRIKEYHGPEIVVNSPGDIDVCPEVACLTD